MKDWDDVCRIACALPGTEMSPYYGTSCPKVNGKAFAAPGRETGSFVLFTASIDEKAMLIETDPATFWQTDHYRHYPNVLARFGTEAHDRIVALMTRAWWDRARKPQREAFGDRPDRFMRFAAIDWSGAKGSRHRGIALAVCEAGCAAPVLVEAPDGIWSRTAILDWLIARKTDPMLVGFDFSFSAPYVRRGAHLPGETTTDSARALWAYVDAQSPDPDLGAASFLEARRGRHFYLGAADGTKADFLHWRTCESPADGGHKPSTVYDAIGASQVAKASFAGMRLLHRLADHMPIWPFDAALNRGAVVVEIYTAIAARTAGLRKGLSKLRSIDALNAALTASAIGSDPHRGSAPLSDHATDAILTAAWLRASAPDPALWRPSAMTPAIAHTEGWTFGVP